MKKIRNTDCDKIYDITKEIVDAIDDPLKFEQAETFKKFISENKYAPQLISRLSSEQRARQLYNELSGVDKDKNALKLEQRIELEQKRKNFRRLAVNVISIAAACIGISFIVFYNSDNQKEPIIAENIPTSNITKPTLILDDDQQVTIDDGNYIDKNDYSIEKIDGQTLKYTSTNYTAKYNQLIIPAGYTQSVILDDGSEVILNAGSSLRYPVKFSGETREVVLEGEAYFKVTKSEKPFKVKTGELTVQVYGTQFNIYNGLSGVVETLLIEGSVGVRGKDNKEIKIIPNQMCRYNSNSGELEVMNVDVNNYIAWTDNKLLYQDATLNRIFHDFSIWFGVELNVDEALKDVKATVVMNRETTLESAISFLEEVLNVKIINEGKGVYTVK